eukprot:gnl/Chilomastix_caulleri/7434.p1 GENE.gnl/Chilomastix_caulleri/7434~~gnl/Chilomastix_caulleri/7434.p1  ORF type:complete len:91 (+),score=28.03 gnl/Chilomastix_caulleri/7434:143-415(+)
MVMVMFIIWGKKSFMSIQIIVHSNNQLGITLYVEFEKDDIMLLCDVFSDDDGGGGGSNGWDDKDLIKMGKNKEGIDILKRSFGTSNILHR